MLGLYFRKHCLFIISIHNIQDMRLKMDVKEAISLNGKNQY